MTDSNTGGALRVRQVRSAIGFSHKQKATLRALGLGKIGRVRQHPDNPQVRGMIGRVAHLVVLDTNGSSGEKE